MPTYEKVMYSVNNLDVLRNKSILVTGATGLIGQAVVGFLSFLSKEKNFNINILAVSRSIDKAKTMPFYNDVEWLFMDMEQEYVYAESVDYIIHTASPTDSKYFITNPVETINSTINGLNSILRFAKQKNVSGFLLTSSMEVYGICCEDKFLSEDEYYSVDCTNIRNSYAEGKKLLECLCVSYGKEYNIPVKIVRLCQTFGPGVSKEDNRVFAQFAKFVINKKDIVLATKGETKRSYCSINDAVSGIITVLINGDECNAYNIASNDSYYSIYEMAEKFIKGTNLNIRIEERQDNKYLPTIKFGLNTEKIKKIGFKSIDSLDSIIKEFLDYMAE